MKLHSVSIVIPAYTLDRWELIRKAVDSAREQTVPVDQVVLCVDNNQALQECAAAEWREAEEPPVRVIGNRHDDHLSGVDTHVKAHGSPRRFGAGSARNSAVEMVDSEIIAFIDDDAWAEPDWLERLLAVYEDPTVIAVGGAPLPDYATVRPAWFPANFDWVFGCAYEGLPSNTAPLRHLIGANMSVRREALLRVGGFQSIDFDDLDMCMRLADKYGPGHIYYEPRAIVHHHVPALRVTWRYFYRRCFFVNREKVLAFDDMGDAANLEAEWEFVGRSLRVSAIADFRRIIAGERVALRSLAAMFVGIALAGAGHIRGRADIELRNVRRNLRARLKRASATIRSGPCERVRRGGRARSHSPFRRAGRPGEDSDRR